MNNGYKNVENEEKKKMINYEKWDFFNLKKKIQDNRINANK